MDVDREIDALARRAREAAADEQRRHAAFLFDRGRTLALERGRPRQAYHLGRCAARSLYYAADYEGALTMLLELTRYVLPNADRADVLDVHVVAFYCRLQSETTLSAIERTRAELTAMYEELRPGGRDGRCWEGYVLDRRGRHDEAVTCYEAAYSRAHVGYDVGDFWVASRCALAKITLGLLADADRWIDRIVSNSRWTEQRFYQSMRRVQRAARAVDVPASLAALGDLDRALAGMQRNRDAGEAVELAVAVLCSAPQYGDPQRETHPATGRLADFPDTEQYTVGGRMSWTNAVLLRELAALRYAAGMSPEQDYFGVPERSDPAASVPRLPRELSVRASTAYRVCEDAAMAAARLDAVFECDWRRRRVANLRRCIDDIAHTHNIAA